MSRRRVKRSKAKAVKVVDYNWADMIGDASVIAALFFVLPYSPLRLENFVSDKAAFLGALLPIIVGGWLVKYLQGWRPEWRAAVKHPIVVGVLMLLGAMLVSTVFSLSPLYSWAGKVQYPNGTYLYLVYVALMVQTILSLPRLRHILLPIVTMLIIMQIIWAVYSFVRLDYSRITSTAGNPNYLSSWLLMGILLIGYKLYSLFTSGSSRLYMVFLVIVALSSFGMMFYAGGRGALVALVFVIVGSVLMIEMVQRRFRWVLITIGVAGVLLAGFMFIAVNMPSIQEDFRVFSLDGDVRFRFMEGGAQVIDRMTEPLLDYQNNQDGMAQMRPLIGYGPEMMVHVQARWANQSDLTNAIHSLHNHILDTLIEKGVLGLAAWMAIIGGAIYVVLNQLQWLTLRQMPLLVALLAVLSGIANVILSTFAPSLPFWTTMPLAFGLALPATVILWVFVAAILRRNSEPLTVTQRHIFLIFALNIILGHWIDIQFAFTQPASEPIFWIVVGWLVYETLPRGAEIEQDKFEWAPTNGWSLAIVFTGAYFVHIKNSMHFNAALHMEDTHVQLVLLGICVIGGIGLWLSREKTDWMLIQGSVVVWILLFVIGNLANNYVNDRTFDAVFPQNIDSAPSLFFRSTLSGMLLIASSFVLYVIPWWQIVRRVSWQYIAIVTVVIIVGCGLYSVDFSTAYIARLTKLSSDFPNQYALLDDLIDEMDGYVLYPQDIYMEYAPTQIKAGASKEDVLETWQWLVDNMPYYGHSQYGWQLTQDYYAKFQEPPTLR